MIGRNVEEAGKEVSGLPNPGHFVQGYITPAAAHAAIITQTEALSVARSILVTNSVNPPPADLVHYSAARLRGSNGCGY